MKTLVYLALLPALCLTLSFAAGQGVEGVDDGRGSVKRS